MPLLKIWPFMDHCHFSVLVTMKNSSAKKKEYLKESFQEISRSFNKIFVMIFNLRRYITLNNIAYMLLLSLLKMLKLLLITVNYC